MAIGRVLYSVLALRGKDVVDNLLSESHNLPLSAYQGNVLDGKIKNVFYNEKETGYTHGGFDTAKEPGFYGLHGNYHEEIPIRDRSVMLLVFEQRGLKSRINDMIIQIAIGIHRGGMAIRFLRTNKDNEPWNSWAVIKE